MRRHSFASILAIAVALSGCTASTLDKESGAEDAIPVDGKADSFRSPTEHGRLRLGSTASNATISSGERFHAWNFSLSGDAEVAVTVSSRDQNLDTVAYLYHRTSDTESWGSYIERNDDADATTLQSAIRADLGAGDYRVLVKGYKLLHQGSFEIAGECGGPGCAPTTPATDIEVPRETGFTEECISTLWESLDATVVDGDSFGVSPEATSGYSREVLIATAHYASMSDYADYLDATDLLDFTFEVDETRTDSGTLVQMADGGDESTTDYAFDADGNLMMYYVHNQSPWTGFFCGDPAATSTYPDDECVRSWMAAGPHEAIEERTGAVTFTPGASNTDVNELMAAAVAVYTETELEGVDGAIEIEFREWTGVTDRDAGSYLLTAPGGVAVEYAVAEGWDGPHVVFESSENGDGPAILCADS